VEAPEPERPRRLLTTATLIRWGCLAALLIFILVAGAQWLAARWVAGRQAQLSTLCMSHLIDLYRGAKMYAADHEDRLPSAPEWSALIRDPYLGRDDVFSCPAAPDRPGYAMNAACDDRRLQDITDPTATVLFYDSSAGKRNAHDALTSLPHPPRHPGGNNGIWVDGHVGVVQEATAKAPK
jgi:prepilin-type processing-associated H-X9-DG protein